MSKAIQQAKDSAAIRKDIENDLLSDQLSLEDLGRVFNIFTEVAIRALDANKAQNDSQNFKRTANLFLQALENRDPQPQFPKKEHFSIILQKREYLHLRKNGKGGNYFWHYATIDEHGKPSSTYLGSDTIETREAIEKKFKIHLDLVASGLPTPRKALRQTTPPILGML